MAKPGRNRGEVERVALRRTEALKLRKGGATYQQIATKLDISPGQACKDVTRALSEVKKFTDEEALSLSTIEDLRLEIAIRAIYPRVVRGDLGAVDRWIRLSESKRKLLGLDAASQHEVKVKSLTDEQLLAKLQEAMDAEGAEA